MSARKSLADDRRRRRLITALWVVGLSTLIIVLIYKELTAILYILATLGVTVLLLIVANSDLNQTDRGASGVEIDARDPAVKR